MSQSYDFTTGETLLIDKPREWTSFDVVKKVRIAVNTITDKKLKVGHAGTLDPLATGLLIICTGKKTKTLSSYQEMGKEYTGVMELGKTTPCVDLEMEFDSETDASHITEEQLNEVLKEFSGWIDQIPPIYSAVKVNGQRVYKHARKGEVVHIDPRKVEIKEFEITQLNLPEIHFKIRCSKGTYIRSLVRDIGEKLGVGAYLKALKRTKIGDYKIEDAHNLQSFIESIQQ